MAVTVTGRVEGPGWACTCPSFRLGDPDQMTVWRAMSRASDVKFEQVKKRPDGSLDFRAWTEPESKYEVVYDPGASGGFCKHIAACAVHLAGGWLKKGYQQVKEETKWKTQTTREMKKLTRELRKKTK